MGQCCCKPTRNAADIVIEGDDYEGSDEFWDARSELSVASFVSSRSFCAEDPASPSEGTTDDPEIARAMHDALNLKKEAKVLGARSRLLELGNRAFWEQVGDEAVLKIFDQASLVDHALVDMHKDDEYMVSREHPLKILYKHEEGGTAHSIKIKCLLEHPISHVVSIPYEWDLLPTWNKYAMDAIKFDGGDTYEALVYGASWMIPPFKDFQAFLKASGVDVSQEAGCLVIIVEDSQDEISRDYELPRKVSERRVVNFDEGSYIILRPVFEDRHVHTDAVLCVHMDPHIKGVPAALVNFALHVFAPYLFKQMDKTLTDILRGNDTYVKRMQATPEVYKLIDNAVNHIRHAVAS